MIKTFFKTITEPRNKKTIVSITSILITVGYLLLYGHHMVGDDNSSQWVPVLTNAIDHLENGDFTIYNIYQFGGFGVVPQGYYGVQNPLLLSISYMIRILGGHIEFSYVIYNLISFLFLAFSMLYMINPKTKREVLIVYVMTIVLLLNSTYLATHNWYYISNCLIQFSLFFISLTFLLRNFNSKLNYFFIATVVCFSAYLGNIQFFFYFVFSLVVTCFFILFFFLKNFRKKFKQLTLYIFVNALLIIIVLSPFIVLSLSFKDVVVPFDSSYADHGLFGLFTFLQEWLLPIWHFKDLFKHINFEYFHQHAYQLISWSFLYMIFHLLFKRTKNNTVFSFLAPLSLSLISLFIILLCFPISSKLPGFSSFRLAFKYLFVIYPLLVIPFSFLAKKLAYKKPQKMTIVFSCIMVFFSILFIHKSSLRITDNNLKAKPSLVMDIIKANDLNLNNYRIVLNFSFEQYYKMRKSPILNNYLTGNKASFYHVSTIQGYEPSLDKDFIKSLRIKHIQEIEKGGVLYGLPLVLNSQNIDLIHKYNIKYILEEKDSLSHLLTEKNIPFTKQRVEQGKILLTLKDVSPITTLDHTFHGDHFSINNLPKGTSSLCYHCSANNSYLQFFANNKKVKVLCKESKLSIINNGNETIENVKLKFHWIYKPFFFFSVFSLFSLLTLLITVLNRFF